MSNYDAVEGFIDYTNKDEWRIYIENYVLPLWKNALVLNSFFERLKDEFDGVALDGMDQDNKRLILGGVVPESGEFYKRNSLARFYNKFFGLTLSDIQSWTLGSGVAKTQPRAMVGETAFIRLVREVLKWSDRAVKNQNLVKYVEPPEVNYEGLKNDPSMLKEAIENFYRSVLSISVNYNYHTFFLWSIKQLTYRFMKEAYPRVDDVIDFLKTEFGLTKFKWENPIKENLDLYKEYTIWCWPEYNATSTANIVDPENSQIRSFGGSVCALNETIWKYFTKGYYPLDQKGSYPLEENYRSELEKTFRDYFGDFPFLKEEYFDKVKTTLNIKSADVFVQYDKYGGIRATIMWGWQPGRITVPNLTIMEALDEISRYLFTVAKIFRYDAIANLRTFWVRIFLPGAVQL